MGKTPIPKLLLACLILFTAKNMTAAPPLKESLGEIPIPRNLTGYRIWSAPPPTLRLEVTEKDLIRIKTSPQITLKIDAPGAREMKLSDRKDFAEAPWREVKEEQPWIFRVRDNQQVYTVYAVFRYQDPLNNRYYISPIIHDTLHIKEPYKKITRTSTGYFDWYDLTMINQTLVSASPGEGERVDFVTLQEEAEEIAQKTAYATVQNIPIHYGFLIKDFLSLHNWLVVDLRETVGRMQLDKMYYPTSQSVFLEQSFSLLGVREMAKVPQNPTLLYSRIIQTLYKEPVPTGQPFTDQDLSALIIDTRGSKSTPTLLAEVVDDKGNPILTPADHTDMALPFIRYLRDLQGDWEIPEKAMVIKALEVEENKNRIIILELYGKIIRNSEEQVENLANGNFYIVTD